MQKFRLVLVTISEWFLIKVFIYLYIMKYFYRIEKPNNHINEDINNFFLGFGLDFRFKFIAHRRCTPVLGIRFNFDPYCSQSSIDENGKETVTDYDKYFKFSFVPSFGFCMNF